MIEKLRERKRLLIEGLEIAERVIREIIETNNIHQVDTPWLMKAVEGIDVKKKELSDVQQ